MATTFYGWILPTVGASADTWGGLLNAVITAQDTQLASPANTIKGNNTGSTAASINLTVTQTTAMLNTMVGDSGAGGIKGLAPAPGAGDAAADKYLRADGGWTRPPSARAWANINGTTGALTAGANASSVKTGTGAYTVTFSTPLAAATFAVTFGYSGPVLAIARVTDGSKTVNGFQFTVIENSGSPIDASEIYFSVPG